jgi:hypothetical protein
LRGEDVYRTAARDASGRKVQWTGRAPFAGHLRT